MSVQIDKRVKEIVASHVDIAIEIDKIQIDDFLDVLGVNSINFIRSVIDIENEFDIQFDIEKLGFENFGNIGELITYVQGKANNIAS